MYLSLTIILNPPCVGGLVKRRFRLSCTTIAFVIENVSALKYPDYCSNLGIKFLALYCGGEMGVTRGE